MEFRLETKPVLSQSDVPGWSQTLTLTCSTGPSWVVVVATEDETQSQSGLDLLESLEKSYHQLELKPAEALYELLKSAVDQCPDLFVAAGCIVSDTITFYGFGQAQVDLVRNDQTVTLLSLTGTDWQAIEGKRQNQDRYWLSVGAFELNAGSDQPSQTTGAGLEISFVPQVPISLPPLERKRRRTLFLGVVVLALLLISVAFGAKTRTLRVLSTKLNSLEQQTQQAIAVSQALYATDQIQARSQLRATLDQLNQAKSDFEPKPELLQRWQTLYNQADGLYQQIAGETQLSEIPTWYPLNTLKPDLKGDRLFATDTDLVVWDQTSATLVTISADNKRGEIVAGGENLVGATSLNVANNKAVALGPQGIVEISLNKKTSTVIVPTDADWRQPQLIGVFGNNVYLIDPGAFMIWRYPAITQGVGAKQSWLGPGVNLPNADYQRLAIDSQIWLLQAGGRITRYTRGAPQSFTLSGLDTPLGSNITSFAVHPDQDLLALLDSDNHRAVITTKAGVYQKQVVWPGLSQAQDIALSADAATLYILSQGIIYATPI